MRPTPVRLPDAYLEREHRALGVGGSLDDALANEPMRAVLQAAARAHMYPKNRGNRSAAARRSSGAAQLSLALPESFIDVKRRAANDIDEE
jgi:hypothetical protein